MECFGYTIYLVDVYLVDVYLPAGFLLDRFAFHHRARTSSSFFYFFYLLSFIHPAPIHSSTHPPIHPSIQKKKHQALLSGFESEAKSLGAKADAVAAATKDIRAGLERGMQGLRAHNGTVLGRHLKTAVKEARSERRSTRVNRKGWCSDVYADCLHSVNGCVGSLFLGAV